MLATPRPLPLLVGYLVGGMITSVGLGIAILVVLDRSGALRGSEAKTTSRADDAGARAVL